MFTQWPKYHCADHRICREQKGIYYNLCLCLVFIPPAQRHRIPHGELVHNFEFRRRLRAIPSPFYSILENSRRYLQQSHRHSMVPVLSSKLLCPSSVALGNLHRTASSFLFNLVIDRISLLFEERVQSIRGSFLLHHSARRRFQASGFAGISGDEGCVPLQFEAAIVDGACARSALAARPCVQVDFVSMLRVDGENSCPDVVFCGGVE